MVFKKIIFQNRYMALETPSRSPPFMAKTILNFHFDYLITSLICLLLPNLPFLMLQIVAPALLEQVSSLLVSVGQDQRSCKQHFIHHRRFSHSRVLRILLPVFLSSNGRISFIPSAAMACDRNNLFSSYMTLNIPNRRVGLRTYWWQVHNLVEAFALLGLNLLLLLRGRLWAWTANRLIVVEGSLENLSLKPVILWIK